MLPQNIIADAIRAGACASGLEWARSEEATIGTVPDRFRCWWACHLPQHLTPWWDGVCCTYADGRREWRRDGRLDREDGPAVEWPDGARDWWRDGRLDREDGPAVEWPDGHRQWWRNGRLDRKDGPALEWPDGSEEYWRDGVRVADPR